MVRIVVCSVVAICFVASLARAQATFQCGLADSKLLNSRSKFGNYGANTWSSGTLSKMHATLLLSESAPTGRFVHRARLTKVQFASDRLVSAKAGIQCEDSVGGNAEPAVRALLVGVSKYSRINANTLNGPPNDVELVSHLLQKKFRIKKQDILILSEGRAKDKLPTFANIEREFATLAQDVKPGDQVVILLSGHGSQLSDDSGDEPDDGKDEVFLTRDTHEPSKKVIANLVTDDLLRKWLDAIRDKGAFVFLIGDTCHSGTISRGDADVARVVDLIELADERKAVELPSKSQLGAANSRAKKDILVDFGEETSFNVARGELVVLSATHPNERTYESKFGGKTYGWLTWTMCQVLANESHLPTYRELAQKIVWQYQQNGWKRPHPLLEGTGNVVDREVLGIQSWPERSRINLTRDREGNLKIDKGALHELTNGSILSVFDDSQKEKPIAYVKVTRVRPLSALVEPVKYKVLDTANNIEAPTFARLEARDLGPFKIHVGVDVSRIQNDETRKEVKVLLKRSLESASSQKESLLIGSAYGEAADWYLVANETGDTVNLSDATYLARDKAGIAVLLQPNDLAVRIDDRLANQLHRNFGRIARYRNLRQLASLANRRLKIKLDAFVEKWDNNSQSFVRMSGSALKVANKDRVRLAFKNNSPFSVDITVLYLQSDFQIKSFFPGELEFNRFPPDSSHTVGVINIDNTTVGLEDLLVVAVRSDGGPLPADFSFLCQDGIQKAQDAARRSRGDESLWDYSLAKICSARMFAFGERARSANREEIESFVIRRISWEVIK